MRQDVLIPYMSGLISKGDSWGIDRRLKLKQLLRTFIILTCKIAVFRQTLLAKNPALDLLPNADAELLHLLARLSCNLELLQSAKQNKHLAQACDAVQRYGRPNASSIECCAKM